MASWFILVSAGCATTTSSQPTTREASQKVAQAASTVGMHRVPLILTGQGSALVETKVNGKELVLLVDTGAQGTVIDLKAGLAAGIQAGTTTQYQKGVGAGRVAAVQGQPVTMDLAGFPARVAPAMQDFSSLTQMWLRRGGKPIVGLLGYDVMKSYGAIIDLNEGAMYLRKP